MPEQVRYKMAELSPTVYLFPDDKGVLKEKKKGGCPFGYTSEDAAAGTEKPFPFAFPAPELLEQISQEKEAE